MQSYLDPDVIFIFILKKIIIKDLFHYSLECSHHNNSNYSQHNK